VDLSILFGMYWLAFVTPFEGSLPGSVWSLALVSAPCVLFIKLACLGAFGAQRSPWGFVDLLDVKRIFLALAVTFVVLAGCRLFFPHLEPLLPAVKYLKIPFGILVLDLMLGFFGMVAVRVSWRLLAERLGGPAGNRRRRKRVPTLLIGTGRAAALIAKELMTRRDSGIQALGFVDDRVGKVGMEIHGVPVLGNLDRLEEIVKEHGAQQALISMPHASGATVRRVTDVCKRCGIGAKIIPEIGDIVDGKVNFSTLRNVAIEDILRREPVDLDSQVIRGLLAGRTVLVTGAGGSIGSEICRQVLRFDPRALILVERAENGLFQIDRELQSVRRQATVHPCIADVLDNRRLNQVFARYRPEVVFHAAAHKHVPMMEFNPGEALKNNVLGTKRVADLARRYGARGFVLISTDKAVKPSSIMGVSKQLAERYVHALSQCSATRFLVVRFGNVLGSAGSVVPIFQEQIRRGGPITITHPDMERYFMTIPEASQLVLQAAAMGKGGEIFVLDMGEPVKILDLARDMIRLSGLGPDDIKIEFVGVRPGEKLVEELHLEDEEMLPTSHPKVSMAYPRPCPLAEARQAIAKLILFLREREDVIGQKLPELVPDYLAVGSRNGSERGTERVPGSPQGKGSRPAAAAGSSPDAGRNGAVPQPGGEDPYRPRIASAVVPVPPG
jgi:FlaA1/EpsC-like NDP-sugar epimerase